jgi:hypothetical protein
MAGYDLKVSWTPDISKLPLNPINFDATSLGDGFLRKIIPPTN